MLSEWKYRKIAYLRWLFLYIIPMHDPFSLKQQPSIPRRHFNRQFLQALFRPNPSPEPTHPIERNPRQKTTLPPLQKSLHTQSASLVILKRKEIEQTISMLKLKHFGPHGASRAHKLQLIKHKRGAEWRQVSPRSLSQIVQNPCKGQPGEEQSSLIVGCSLEESILCG